jgi:hypothetical protein
MTGICTIATNVCVPIWQCEPGQTGYEIDGCGNRRANTDLCNPTTPPGIVVGSRVCALDRSSGNKYSADVIELVYNGAKLMVWGYPGYPNGLLAIFAYTDYTEGDCAGIPPPPVCVPVWNCELPLNGWEADGCGNRRGNGACNPPIAPKWNVSIYARDSVAGTVIPGATVTVGTQSQVTDVFGMALFTVDQGTISISISKTGYTTFNKNESVFAHSTFIYPLVSSLPPPIYREAGLASCAQIPPNIVVGQFYPVTIIINQGSKTENYKLVFSGGYVAESVPFSITAGTGQIESTYNNLIFGTGGPKNVTISLVKII